MKAVITIEAIEDLLVPLLNRIEALQGQIKNLERQITQAQYTPVVDPKGACEMLGIGRDRLWELCQNGTLKEGVHWYWKNPMAAKKKRRLFFADLLFDYAIRGQRDPNGHLDFCKKFHERRS